MSNVAVASTGTTSTTRIVVGLGVAAVTAAVVNTAIGLLGALVLGAVTTGLDLPAPAAASVAGVLIGAAGWATVRRSTPNPAAALRAIVPVAVALSWVPDLLLLTMGATVANVLILMLMHLVVVAAVVPALRTMLPVARPTSS